MPRPLDGDSLTAIESTVAFLTKQFAKVAWLLDALINGGDTWTIVRHHARQSV